MKLVKLLGLAAMVATVLAVGVEANAKSTIANSPCKEDRQRLCPQFPNGKAGPCLKKHLKELSPACKAKVLGN
ncbi:MAG: hypothetical protein J0I79_00605 [Mesorhizobium sp.]|uniref:hypothetical protein n=1 Tax=Mesorhizobium sp. TaxID=1871066 RepID=UPI001AC96F38|nr:hypothetical protein [Mesorhizobium sp.]MBN9216430.1 hypothetical protein [Mesorhizobium sp.]